MRTRPLFLLGLSVALAFAAAGIGGLATAPNVDGWYRALEKPSWTPPGWLFGPVWTALYLAMAVAAWWVWTRGEGAARRRALGLYLAQLATNALWSPVFFAWHRPGWALVVILVLLVLVAATTAAFFRIGRLAGWLLVPYLAWVAFATVLNHGIWRLNP